MSFPIDRAIYRVPPQDWAGQVVVADVDRTYLETHFSSLRGMARIPFELARHKRDIVGMARLLRAFRHGPDELARDTPLYFVSASPRQLRPVIEGKLELDGIGFDGTTFKDWGGVVRRGRLKRLREQIGFKLTALLAGREGLPATAAEILVGDDLETDPVAFALYADAVSGRRSVDDLIDTLARVGVLAADIASIAASVERARARRVAAVERAFIRMERHLSADELIAFAPGVVACKGALQMAAAAWKFGHIREQAVVEVGAALVERGTAPVQLRWRIRDLVRRCLVDVDDAARLLAELGLDPFATWPEADLRWQRAWARGEHAPWLPDRHR